MHKCSAASGHWATESPEELVSKIWRYLGILVVTTAKKKRTAPQAWKSSLLSYHTLKLINFTSEMQLNLYFIVWYDNTVFPDVLGLKHLPPPSSSPAQV